MLIKLENHDDVRKAARLVSWLGRPLVERVSVSLPGLDRSRQEALEKKIKNLFNDCGCLWAGPVFLLTFGLIFFSVLHGESFSWGKMVFSFSIGALAALGAKFLALAVSSRRLKNCLDELGASIAGR